MSFRLLFITSTLTFSPFFFPLSLQIDLVVVTDSEGILGIGDQGVGGILISSGKANIYTLGSGIDPSRILSVVLDVGTDNPALLNDPLYLGMRRKRIRGEAYDKFVDEFCDIVREEYPRCVFFSRPLHSLDPC